MHLFYGTYQESYILLSEAETHHLSKVLRLKEGDEVLASTGDGKVYNGRIKLISKKQTLIEKDAVYKEESEKNVKLSIGVGILKTNERLEWLLEKATELGVSQIHLLQTERTERNKINPERLQKIITAACKQSLKGRIPSLVAPQKFIDFVKTHAATEQKFIAHCQQWDLSPLKHQLKSGLNTVLLIGPEGDFTEKEVTDAEASGFKSCGLGKERLRTETAAIVAVVTVKNTI
ncbi:MAG: RsmE family RNA methyltransferase [Flavobacteriales bacterium]